ncbi:MAG TPA: class I SAM-dependent methyltransferase [Candidatus Saccharimonadales bacterium]|nr:class I SAM-dependent methyltransferase [Candidatus Saccharimonadales bacterium]
MVKTDENEQGIQKKLVRILNDSPELKNQIEKISFNTNRTEIIHKRESDYAFLYLFEPMLRKKKVLDLFCGTNPIKQFSEQNHTEASVTGIDNSETNIYCDVRSDVIDLPKIIKPNCQFDIITSFGGTRSENFSDDYNYLNKNGLLVHGYSSGFFTDNGIEAQLDGSEKIQNQWTKELLKYFQPIIIVKVNGIHLIIHWPSQKDQLETDEDMVYIIFRKKDILNDSMICKQ